MEFIEAKSILTSNTKSFDDFFPWDYIMNIYKGCCHGCIYCDSRSTCYQIDTFGKVRIKKNALILLENELKHKRKKGIISTGSMSDPYNQFEKKYELTRNALKLIDKYNFGVGITTKSALIVRDIDILTSILNHSPVHVSLSITTINDELCKKIEPNVSVSNERFDVIKKLSNSGIYVGVWLNPVLPFLTDSEENILDIIKMSYKCGAKYVVCDYGVTMRSGNREYFYENLNKNFPYIKEKYAETFGNKYFCISPNAKKLWNLVQDECNKYNLLCHIKKVSNAIKNTGGQKQISFL